MSSSQATSKLPSSDKTIATPQNYSSQSSPCADVQTIKLPGGTKKKFFLNPIIKWNVVKK